MSMFFDIKDRRLQMLAESVAGLRAGRGCAPQDSFGPVRLPLRRIKDDEVRALPKQQPCA